MIVLSIDASTTAWGWALAEVYPDVAGERFIACGRITAPQRKPFVYRLAHMADILSACVFDDRELPAVNHAIIEVSTKPQGREANRAGHRVGMLGAGAAIGLCSHYVPVPNIHAVEVNEWTAGQRDKQARAMVNTAGVACYDADEDSGLDVADAIGMLRRWNSLRVAGVMTAEAAS